MNEDTLRRAYALGATLANEGFEKRAFLGAVLRGGKFLLGMGHLGNAGGLASRISAHHIGMPLGFGAVNAATAEEGHRAEAFGVGVLGGLAFNAGMGLGGRIGKRMFAPMGRGTSGLARMGFTASESSYLQASRDINKYLHTIQRKMSSGNYDPQKALKEVNRILTKHKVDLGADTPLANSLKQLTDQSKNLTPDAFGQFHSSLSGLSGGLKDFGLSTASSAAKGRYTGVRLAKNIGGLAGGVGMGMYADSTLHDYLSHPPASIYSPDYGKGGH